MTIEQQLSAANEQIATLTTERDAARTQAQTNHATAQSVTVERDAATTQLSALTSENTNLKAQVANIPTQVAAEAQSLLQRELAKAGHPPVALGHGEEIPGRKAKQDFSHLTGLDKAIAAHKASVSSNN